jgi:hypothetical protein
MFILLILLVVIVSAVVRLLTAPFRYGYRHRGYGPYYNPYQYGCRRHHRLLGGVLPILALVALDRIFGGRRW